MVVQWLFNGCSMVGGWLSPCVVVVGVRGEHECGCGSGFCFVSHEFCFLRVEIRVYWGRCFSWKAWQFFATAWQIFATAWQKIRMPCAVVRQGRCLDVFRDVFSFICVITTSETVGTRWQTMRRADEERELRQPRKAQFDLHTFPPFMQLFGRKESLFNFFWNFV